MSFFVHIEGREAEDVGCLLSYWHPADDLDRAIHESLSDAEDRGLAIELRPSSVDHRDDEAEATGFVPARGELYIDEEMRRWRISPLESDFILPWGVVRAAEEAVFADDQLREAYGTGEETGFHWLEMVVDRRRADETLERFVKGLPKIDAIEVRLLDHQDDVAPTEIWTADVGSDDSGVWPLMTRYARDLLQNGHVEVAFWSSEADTAVRWTEHRTVLVTSTEQGRVLEAGELATELGFNRGAPFRSVAVDCHHRHYARVGARDRESLREWLPGLGLRLVQETW